MVSIRTVYKQLQAAASEAVAGFKSSPDESTFGLLVETVLRQAPEATEDQARRAVRKAIRRRFELPLSRAGSAPNTSVVLSAAEIAFIEREFDGRRSEAIHTGLALLMQKRGHK